MTSECTDLSLEFNEQLNFDLLNDVLKFWFPNSYYQEFWFSPTKDDEIRIRFSNLFNRLEQMNVDSLIEWLSQISLSADDEISVDHTKKLNSNFDISSSRKLGVLAIVICLDQFSRNIYRGTESIYKNDKKCYQIVDHFQSHYNMIERYEINQRIFYLLPYRHQKTTLLLNYVVVFIREMEEEISNIDTIIVSSKQIKEYRSIVSRFKRATLRDYSKVKDTISHFLVEWKDRSGNLIMEPGSANHMIGDYQSDTSDILDILDPTCINYSSIVSGTKIKYYSSDVMLCNVYRLLREFYNKRGIRNASVSLSGGVDSMVISYALHHLRLNCELDSISAIHIDYGNREVSRREANFVTAWCEFLRIPLLMRRIEHIHRNGDDVVSIERCDYEQFTKELRFNMYREAMTIYESESIVLGHHGDDLTENVLMNTLRGGDLLDLFTMVDHQIIDGVPIDRPLLSIVKNDIFEFAHKFEIPYLADTTSESCMRGTIRKKVIPALEDVDKGIRKSLMSVGHQSIMWKNAVENIIIRPIISNFVIGKFGTYLPWKDEYANLDEIIWKTILVEIFHRKIGTSMMKTKNLTRFRMWLRNRNGMISFSNNYMGIFHKSNLIFIRNGIASLIEKLPEGKTNNFSQPIRLNMSNPKIHINFNGWTITCESVNNSEYVGGELETLEVIDGQFEIMCKSIYVDPTDIICKKIGFDTFPIPTIMGCLTYGMYLKSNTKKKSHNRRYFSDCDLNRYIPKIHIFQTDSKYSIHTFRIRYTYK